MVENRIQSAAKSALHPQRVVKTGLVCDSGGSLVEGVVIDPAELSRLAHWMCEWDVFHHHEHEPVSLRRGLNDAGGFCDRCREDAGRLLSECPYIEMDRSTEVAIQEA